jgi:hypothetical protein
MATSTIGAIAEAITAIAGLGAPLLDESIAQRYRLQQINALSKWSAALRAGDLVRMQRFVDRLLVEAGEPLGMVTGRPLQLDVEYIDQLVRLAINARRQQLELQSLLAALKRQTT